MLLKWLLTALAMIWLYQAIQQLLLPNGKQYYNTPPPRKPAQPEPPPRPEGEISIERKNKEKSDGEYIDYEELK